MTMFHSKPESDIFREFQWIVGQVVKTVKYTTDRDNLIGVGNLALLRAIRAFDETRSKNFPKFATRIIRQDIYRQIDTDSKFPSCGSVDEIPYNDNHEQFESEVLRMRAAGYTYDEISDEIGISPSGAFYKVQSEIRKLKECEEEFSG